MDDAARVLVIDDEKVIRHGCERALESEGYSVAMAEDGSLGIEMMERERFDVVLLDLMMPGIDGFQVLEWIQTNCAEVPVIVITGFATVTKAVEAMKRGAFDFVGKPFTPEYIRIVVARALEKCALEREAERLREEKFRDLMAIAEEKSRLRTVFSSMLDGVLIINKDGVVVHHNPAAIKSLQIETDPLVGKKLCDAIRDPDLLEMVRDAIERGGSRSREFPRGAISRVYMRVHCAPVLNEDEEVLGAVASFQDISSQKNLEQQKAEFVAMVVHELRAPLASIEQMIYAMGLSCEHISGTDCERLQERVTLRTRELLQMIGNLLNLSKLESESLALDLEPIEGDDVLRNVLEVLRPQAESKKIRLTYKAAAKPWWFSADYEHIRNAISNVVGNAIKYTPENGEVELRCGLRAGLVDIVVRDNGIGISKEDLPHIFDRFYRVKGAATRMITGSGLGLSVVKRIVEAHNGFTCVESQEGRGTVFTLSFPTVRRGAQAGARSAAGEAK